MINIVLPVDFGEATDKLIDGAVKFAKQINGKICMIHVAPADIGFAIGDMGFQYFPEIEQNEIKEELSQLNQIQQRIISLLVANRVYLVVPSCEPQGVSNIIPPIF